MPLSERNAGSDESSARCVETARFDTAQSEMPVKLGNTASEPAHEGCRSSISFFGEKNACGSGKYTRRFQ
jgi:hypothetical protein